MYEAQGLHVFVVIYEAMTDPKVQSFHLYAFFSFGRIFRFLSSLL